MKNIILDIIHMNNDYTGNGMYMAFYLVTLLCFFFILKDDKLKRRVAYPQLLLLFLIYVGVNVMNYVLARFSSQFDNDIKGRFVWVFMIPAVAAIGCTLLADAAKDKKNQMLLTAAFVPVIFMCGVFQITDYRFQKAENLYKIPQVFIDMSDDMLRWEEEKWIDGSAGNDDGMADTGASETLLSIGKTADRRGNSTEAAWAAGYADDEMVDGIRGDENRGYEEEADGSQNDQSIGQREDIVIAELGDREHPAARIIVPYETAYAFRQYSTRIELLYGEDATFGRIYPVYDDRRDVCDTMQTTCPDLELIQRVGRRYDMEYILFDCAYVDFGLESINDGGYTEDENFVGDRTPDPDAVKRMSSSVSVVSEEDGNTGGTGSRHWDLSAYGMEYMGIYGRYLLYRCKEDGSVDNKADWQGVSGRT